MFLGLAMVLAAAASAQPTFNKVFVPDTIGPGSVSNLTFTITNGSGSPVTSLAFTDNLPAGVTIATPASPVSDCLGATGTLSAPDGGTTITLVDGSIGGFVSCSVSVNVTSSVVATHMNVSGDLTSSAGNSGNATDDLVVVATLPGFSKSFAPASIPRGNRSTLTFTIDNSANAGRVGNLDFTDNLPAGMVVADPANASTDCISASAPNTTLTAVPGTGAIILDANGSPAFPGFEVLPAGATCTVTVAVLATGAGMLENVSSTLQADFVAVGSASATLEVTRTDIALAKSFTDDPVPPGGTVTLEFTIDNFDRGFSATGVAFTDDLAAALPGLTFSSLLSNDCGGAVAGAGTTTVTLSGGTIAPESSCTIQVSLDVPGGATPGAYTNTTGAVTGTVDGSPVTGNAASDDIFVEPVPLLTKEFLDDPVNPGESVVLEFTVTNTSTTSAATALAFTDVFDTVIQTASATPASDCCGAGSTCSFTPLVDPPPPSSVIPAQLTISGGSLAPAGSAGDSCTFSITLDVADGAAPGVYPNTTSSVTATIDGTTRTGEPASDDLTVIAAPRLTKAFTDDPVAPGGAVTLEFSLTHPADAPGDATGITFTDDLATVLSGLTATGLPLAGACDPDGPSGDPGTGTLTASPGGTLLTFAGGTLSPGESCAFSVTLDVPAGATPGSYTNTTSGVAASVGGQPAVSSSASDNLKVAGLTFTKEFIDDPVVPGETVTLRFTIENTDPTDDASGIQFTDSLTAILPGTPDLTVSGALPSAPCGPTSSITGATSLSFAGGELVQGASCTFDVVLQVPAAAPDGSYANVTSSLLAVLGGGTVTVDPASDTLVVDSDLLRLTKEFTDDPVAPGASVNLRFTLTNLDGARQASAVAFTDDLGAVLPGLTATGLPFAACGGTVDGIPDSATIDFSGGVLGPGAECSFDVSVAVPADASAGAFTNTTAEVTGMIDGLAVTGDPANDNLTVRNLLLFSKSFDGPTTAGGTAVLSFTITNPGTDTATDIAFTDDLDAVISGLVATSWPTEPCGAGSEITGSDLLAFSGGQLAPMGGTCSFDVDVLVPPSATAGTFPNVTSELFRAGLPVADPATADLVIEPAPTFAKAFSPDVIGIGGGSTLIFTIDNSASSLAATDLDFTDNLPAGVVVATPANASTTCTGGTLTATGGTGTITYTGGAVAAAASCTVQADVTGSAVGVHVNTTGDLTSSSGSSGTATATLSIGQILLSKSFLGTPPALAGGTVDLEFTIINDSAVSADSIGFTDDLGAALAGLAATGLPATDVCGTGSSISGTGLLTFTAGLLGPGATCTVTVTLQVPADATTGSYTNTTSAISGRLGVSLVTGSPATAGLSVQALPTVSIDDVSAPEGDSGTTDFVFTVSLTESISGTVTVDFATADGTAVAGGDYNATSGTVTFAPGDTSETVTVQVLGDLLVEPTEDFFVDLSSPSNAIIGDGQGLGTILSDERFGRDDFDADGKADMLLRNLASGVPKLWFMDGASVLGERSFAAVSGEWRVVGVGDFNADQRADILWRESGTGKTFIWLMDGANNPLPGSGFTSALVGERWLIEGLGDLDGDQRTDILWRYLGPDRSQNGLVYAWLMDGTQIADAGVIGNGLVKTWDVEAIADLDGDGREDALWRQDGTGLAYVWLMNGVNQPTGGWATVQNDADWSIEGIGDLDGDGRGDFVWRNHLTGEVEVWLMDGATVSTEAPLPTVTLSWQLQGAADFDGDSHADLLWRNSSTGQTYLWFMSGTSIAGAAFTDMTAGTGWEIESPNE